MNESNRKGKNSSRISLSEDAGESTPSERSSNLDSNNNTKSNARQLDVPATINVGAKGPPPIRAKPKSKKPEGMPRRPLSAYNFFYKAERVRWLEEQRRLSSDATKNNSFLELGKAVSSRWKKLSPEELAPYEAEAKRDLKRYHREMEEYNINLVRKRPSHNTQSAAALAAAEYYNSGTDRDRYSSLSDGSSSRSSENGQLLRSLQQALPTLLPGIASQVAQQPTMVAKKPPAQQLELSPLLEKFLTLVLLCELSPDQIQEAKGLLEQLAQVLSLMSQLRDLERVCSAAAQEASIPMSAAPPAPGIPMIPLAASTESSNNQDNGQMLMDLIQQLQQQNRSN